MGHPLTFVGVVVGYKVPHKLIKKFLDTEYYYDVNGKLFVCKYKKFDVLEASLTSGYVYLSIYPLENNPATDWNSTDLDCKLTAFDYDSFYELKNKLKRQVKKDLGVWDENNFGIYSITGQTD